jgi:hypothetical protein
MRFWAVWVTGLFLEVSGAMAVALTFVSAVLIFEYQRQPAGIPADEFSAIVAGLAALGFWRVIFGGLLLALALFTAGQLLAVLLQMERNSRRTSEVLAAELNKLIVEEMRRFYGLTKGE